MCNPLFDAAGCVKAAAGDALGQLRDAVIEGVVKSIASLGTFWVQTPTPSLINTETGVVDPAVLFLQNNLLYYTAIVAFVALILGAGKAMISHRGDGLSEVAKSIFTLALVSGAGLMVLQLFISAADQFSVWLINLAAGEGGFEKKLTLLLSMDSSMLILAILLGVLAILVSLFQVAIMIGRGGLLVVLAGTLTLSASFTNTATGKQWFQRFVAIGVATILYKPAAAIIYAAAFQLVGSWGEDALVKTMGGLALMLLALVAGPALFKFVMPMVAAVAGSSGGAMIGSALGSAAGSAVTGSMKPRSGGGGGFASSKGPGGLAGNKGESAPSGSGNDGAAARKTNGSVPSKGGSAGSGAPSGAAQGGAAAKAAAPSGAAAAGSSGAAAAAGPVGIAAAAAVKVAGAAKQAAEGVAADTTGPTGNG